MKYNEIKKAKAEKAWELAKQLVDSMEFDDLDAFNNFANINEDERSMVIFLTGVVKNPTIADHTSCLLIFREHQKNLLSEIVGLADNVIISSVEGQVRFTIGFMNVVI